MTEKIIIKKSKPNFFSIATGLFLFFYAYRYFDKGSLPMAIIAGVVGVLGVIHNVLLLTTPLLIHKNDSLVVKPKIPFEKKSLLIEEIKEIKANSEAQLVIIMENKSKVKLDMGGFKKKEIEEAKKYLLALI
ncbi:MAG: hypothetical protein MK078_15440 [Crocinitomicaceae bacterium]|nr:hypothetical protein [Crocinitomicaceae bacterium]